MGNCLCCESAHLTELIFTDEFHGANLIKCAACKHIQIAKPPSERELYDYYAHSYSLQRNKYAQRSYQKIMGKRAIAQLNYCHAHTNGPANKILDIGCGYGGILSLTSQNGIEALGLEYDISTVDYGKRHGLPIKSISSERDITAEISSFLPELIVMSHALEHFSDPVKILQACHQTRVFIEVPAYSDDLPEQFINQEGHVNFFNENSLLALLSRLGFTIEDYGSYGPALSFFWKESWSFPRKILRSLSRDYFLHQYANRNSDGIWIRVLAKGPSCKY